VEKTLRKRRFVKIRSRTVRIHLHSWKMISILCALPFGITRVYYT